MENNITPIEDLEMSMQTSMSSDDYGAENKVKLPTSKETAVQGHGSHASNGQDTEHKGCTELSEKVP